MRILQKNNLKDQIWSDFRNPIYRNAPYLCHYKLLSKIWMQASDPIINQIVFQFQKQVYDQVRDKAWNQNEQ
jgi:hypothetical protein